MDDPPVCFACGKDAPNELDFILERWVSRRVSFCEVFVVELYCASCYAKWGFVADTTTPDVIRTLGRDIPSDESGWAGHRLNTADQNQ